VGSNPDLEAAAEDLDVAAAVLSKDPLTKAEAYATGRQVTPAEVVAKPPA